MTMGLVCNKKSKFLLQITRNSVENKILSKIVDLLKGELLMPSDFSEMGSSEAVRLALFRLKNAGEITRVAKGIYVRPKESNLIGELLPTAEEIAIAIAKPEGIKSAKW